MSADHPYGLAHDDRIRAELDRLGIHNAGQVFWNRPTAALYEEAVRRREGLMAHSGPLVVRTGRHTGRAAEDKYIVSDALTVDHVDWGRAQKPFEPARFEALARRLFRHFEGRDVFVQDCFVGADPDFRFPVRVITEQAWHSLFARNMFLRQRDPKPGDLRPAFTVVQAPGFDAEPKSDGTRSNVFVMIDFGRGLVLIGGTGYAGEIKKAIFTLMNFLLPERQVLPMHCSANLEPTVDEKAEPEAVPSALFFGLSGTGKTTLSADAGRRLIGDDEHGWSERGIFNFEGGCYAKVIRLSPEAEPEIYATTRRFGTILENVVIDAHTRRVDLEDDTVTENTRASYPIHAIPGVVAAGRGGQPRYVFFLTADAFGVLPPIARLSPAEAVYHFLSGYTAKVAGTELGIKEPKATFSTCFGAPFMPRHPEVYARLLGRKLDQTGAQAWLINTGWTGGPYGTGTRIRIAHSRAMVRAVLAAELERVETEPDPFFGLAVPRAVPGVPAELLRPHKTWADPAAYAAQARQLAAMFHDHFARFAARVGPEVRAAGPRRC